MIQLDDKLPEILIPSVYCRTHNLPREQASNVAIVLRERGYNNVKLRVARAYHSVWYKGARTPTKMDALKIIESAPQDNREDDVPLWMLDHARVTVARGSRGVHEEMLFPHTLMVATGLDLRTVGAARLCRALGYERRRPIKWLGYHRTLYAKPGVPDVTAYYLKVLDSTLQGSRLPVVHPE